MNAAGPRIRILAVDDHPLVRGGIAGFIGVQEDMVLVAEAANGREAIQQFLTRKWAKELEYRLIKELWACQGNRIAVRFAYEWHDDSGNWYRSYGNENWEFDDRGFMQRRIASINDLPIAESERKYHWQLGRRPDDHAGLSALGL